MDDNFGIVTFDNRGPIKSWSQLVAVQAHNNRETTELHCDPDGPEPLHLIGNGSLVADTKARLNECEIDPDSLRKNVALAYEAVLSASHPYFAGLTEEEEADRLAAFLVAVLAFVKAAWKRVQIVSLVLHRDEYTPHFHIVLLPLVQKIYRRWPERGEAWALNGRAISGPGEYQRVHDLYAAHMAPLGLKRGVSRSRMKYRPYAAELGELDAAKAKAVDAAAASEKAMAEVREERARLTAEWFEQHEQQKRIRTELDARKAQIAADGMKLEVRRREVRNAQEIVDQACADAVAKTAVATDELNVVERTMRALDTTIDHALAFREGLLTLPLDRLPDAAIDVLRTIKDFERAAELIELPDAERLPDHVVDRFAKLKQGLGR
ncbi:plasmid recombination protein [Sphingomonas aurantiaca]|uniref:plasmid recombination protein n=1 Tax=Sphingomonas aurantiaca TaxID=185949 RepID=UPI002FE2679F